MEVPFTQRRRLGAGTGRVFFDDEGDVVADPVFADATGAKRPLQVTPQGVGIQALDGALGRPHQAMLGVQLDHGAASGSSSAGARSAGG